MHLIGQMCKFGKSQKQQMKIKEKYEKQRKIQPLITPICRGHIRGRIGVTSGRTSGDHSTSGGRRRRAITSEKATYKWLDIYIVLVNIHT